MTVTWSQEDEQRLRELWARGDTAKQIGHTLGYSRSAVLGKKWRLGLEGRESGGAAAARARVKLSPEERSARARKAVRIRWARHHSEEADARRIMKPAKIAPRIRVIAREGRLVEPLNLPFGDLDDHNKPAMCRYPTIEREGQQLFCARPTEHGTSYCDDCARVVFTAEGYERQINKPAALRQPASGRVAKPFRMPYELAGVALEAREVSPS
jgi:hypothetical protein